MKKTIILLFIGIQSISFANWPGCYSQSEEVMKKNSGGKSEPAGFSQITYLKLEKNHRISSFSKYSTQTDVMWPQSGVWYEKNNNVYYLVKLKEKFHIGKLSGTPTQNGISNFEDCDGRLALSPSTNLKRSPCPTFTTTIPEDELKELLKQLKDVVNNYPKHHFIGADSEKDFIGKIKKSIETRDAKAMFAMTYFENDESSTFIQEYLYRSYSSILLSKVVKSEPYEYAEKHIEYVSKEYGYPDVASQIKVLLINETLFPYGKVKGKWCFINQKEKN